jgi:lipopolysaccharide-binding protein
LIGGILIGPIKMKLTLFATFCVCLAVLVAGQAGFKTTLSKRGLDYARDIGMAVLRRELGNLKIPDQTGQAGTPIGKITWWLSNLRITGINLPDPQVNIAPNSHLQLLVPGVAVNLAFNWRIKKSSFPPFSDSGSGTCDVGNTRLVVDFAIVAVNGKAQAQVRGVHFSIGNFNLKLRGGASWLYNIIIGLFKGSVRGNIEKEVREAISKEIHGKLNAELAKLPYHVELKPTGVGLDYAIVANPIYAATHLTLPVRGEFFDITNRTRSEHNAPQVPDYLGENKMLHLILSDFVIKSAGETFHKKGHLKTWILDKMIPPWSPVRLNSSSFGVLIPGLQRHFPNQELRIHLQTSRNPEFEIREQNATARIFGDFAMHAVDSNGAVKPAFILNGYVVASGKASIDGRNIVGELLFVSQKFLVKETQIGEINVQMFDDLMNMFFSSGIIPAINYYLKQGIPLPTLRDIDLVNPEVRWGTNFLSISTDVKYALPRVLEQINLMK